MEDQPRSLLDGDPARAARQQVLVVAAGRLGQERGDLVGVAGAAQGGADGGEDGVGVAVGGGELHRDLGVADLGLGVGWSGHLVLLAAAGRWKRGENSGNQSFVSNERCTCWKCSTAQLEEGS